VANAVCHSTTTLLIDRIRRQADSLRIRGAREQLTSIPANREVRQVLNRLSEFIGDRLQRQPYVALHHKVQVRPGAVAGVA
jgi:hypothetical protein